jgi:hypothetical protein
MTELFYVGFIASCVLFVVTATATLRAAELRFPAFKAFLDRHFPEPDDWRSW